MGAMFISLGIGAVLAVAAAFGGAAAVSASNTSGGATQSSLVSYADG